MYKKAKRKKNWHRSNLSFGMMKVDDYSKSADLSNFETKKSLSQQKNHTEFLKAERNYGWKESSNSFQKRFYGWVLNEYNYSFDENLNSVA